MDATFGAFQSLLQLSVGINLTFAVIVTLFDTSIAREQRVARSLLIGLRSLPDIDERKRHELLEKADLALVKIDATAQFLERIMLSAVRPLCLVCSLIAFSILLLASYRNSDSISFIFQIACLSTFLPFLFFGVLVFYQTSALSHRVESIAQEIDNAVLGG
jgi:hypothetical protein